MDFVCGFYKLYWMVELYVLNFRIIGGCFEAVMWRLFVWWRVGISMGELDCMIIMSVLWIGMVGGSVFV